MIKPMGPHSDVRYLRLLDEEVRELKSDTWRYEIGTGKAPMVLSLIMLTIFAGLSVWLYSRQNGAFIFGAMLTVITTAVVLITVYRYFFYKVYIGRDGFYYQTQHCNGAYYPYCQVRKAWISSGKDLSGHEQDFCNIEVPGRPLIRFQFFYKDKKGIRYLIQRTEIAAKFNGTDNGQHEYRIDGKQYGKASIAVVVVLVIMELVILLLMLNTGKFFIIPCVIGIVLMFFVLGMVIVRYFFYRIQICEQGFYYQTTPYNGAYFQYTDIVSCREVVRVYHHRGSADRLHYFYFVFTDKNGRTRKFLFNKPMYEHEVNVLKERIESQYPG